MDTKSELPKPFVFPVMKKTIEDLFTKSSITNEDVQAFQDKYWEQLVPNFRQALKLLDIHGVPRHNILWSINDRLMDAIKSRVDDSKQKKTQKLWQKLIKTGIVYVHHPYMRSLIMQVLGKMNEIKKRHVNLIVDNKYLYNDAPLPVLRHIWVAIPHKFQEELDKVIETFQNSWSTSIFDALSMSIMANATSTAELVPILYWPPRRRRRDPSIIRIVEMIGEDQVLYDKTIRILREECARYEKSSTTLLDQQYKLSLNLYAAAAAANSVDATKSDVPQSKRRRQNSTSKSKPLEPLAIPYIPLVFMPNPPSIGSATLCTLRFDLLMSLNEAKVDKLCVPDRIHRFVWCLDACVRNRRIDSRHASELAYHLQLQRRRWKARKSNLTDQSNSDLNDPDYNVEDEGGLAKGDAGRTKNFKANVNKMTLKSVIQDDAGDDEDEDMDGIQKEDNVLERDMHMACKDPWVVYTICVSLIRYVLHGLYEDKLPRNIPEVNLLVHLLVLGLGSDLNINSSPLKKSAPNFAKRNTKVANDEADCDIPTCPAKAMIGHVLPAIAKLQVQTWRAQVAEEILASTSLIWPNCESTTVSAAVSQSNPPIQRSTSGGSSEQREQINPPLQWQKRIKDATQSTNITLPSEYLSHPIGYLMLQYHALFALERNELAVLRVLLKAAASVAQSKSNRTSAKATANTSAKHNLDSPPPTSTKLAHHPVIFRWRPEVLQALVLGIARLPTSAPAYVDSSRSSHNAGGSTESDLRDTTGEHDGETSSNANASVLIHRSNIGSASLMISSDLINSNANTKSSGPVQSGHEGTTSSSSVITRASLAGLLRSSLPLVNDVQLLALAQISLLVAGPTSANSIGCGSTTASTNLPSSDTSSTIDQPLSPVTVLSERERLINTLARHCTLSTESSTSTAPTAESSVAGTITSVSTTSSGASYKSTNPRVLAVLDVLRKDVEKNFNPLSSPTNFVGMKCGSSNVFNSFNFPPNINASSSASGSSSAYSTNFSAYQSSDGSWIAPSPRSPVGTKYARLTNAQFPYTTNLKNSSLTYSHQSSAFGMHPLPIGTPLTNPGLMAATPSLNNLTIGQATMPTPSSKLSPPYEFRPPLSPPSSTTAGLSKHARFASDISSYASCPSPAVHKTRTWHSPPRTPPPHSP